MRTLLVAASVLCITPAWAISDDIVKAMAGTYLVAPQDGTQGCVILFGTETAIGGYTATVKEPCSKQSPLYERLYSWNFVDSHVVLMNAERHVLLRLAEQEGGPYRTADGEQPSMLMGALPAGVDRVPMAVQFFGEWTLYNKAGKKLCGMALRDQATEDGEESFALNLSKDCDASIKRLKLASWRIEDFTLALYGNDGESIILTPDGKGNAVTEDARYSLKR